MRNGFSLAVMIVIVTATVVSIITKAPEYLALGICIAIFSTFIIKRSSIND